MAYRRKYPPWVSLKIPSLYKYTIQKLLFCKRSSHIFLHWLQRSVLRNWVGKKSSDTQGNIFHEFEGTQSRVSINRSDGLNFKKYRLPDRTERLKSSLELHFTNSLLYGAFNKLIGPESGEISGVLTPNQCQIPR